MEKKFIIIMLAIILLLIAALGVRLFSGFDTNLNLGTNRGTSGNIAGDPAGDASEDIAAQDAEGDTAAQEMAAFQDDLFNFGGIAWRVLDVQDGKMLLLSEYVLEYRVYHPESDRNLVWEISDMRNWLNRDFYHRFTEANRARIAETDLINDSNPWFNTPGGADTTDKIFLLCVEELIHYFGSFGLLERGQRTGEGSRISDRHNANRRAQSLNRKTYSDWWLRSPGNSNISTTHVDAEGVIHLFGSNARLNYFGVRPSLWLYMTPLDYVGVAQIYMNRMQFDEAASVLQQGLEEFPENTEIQTLFAYMLEKGLFFQEAEIQNVIQFGEMQWIVLDVKEDKMLLLSEYVLEQMEYHGEDVDITWADSDIRRWLNDEFYHRFTGEERNLIVETNVINNDNPWFGTSGGEDTTDKIFLLSLEELALYFCDSGQLARRGRFGSERWEIRSQFGDRLQARGVFEFGEYAFWWLRSPGYNDGLVVIVDWHGTVDMVGYLADMDDVIGIRPAMWVYL